MISLMAWILRDYIKPWFNPPTLPSREKNAREPQANMLLMFSLHLRRFLRFLIELNTGIKEQNIKKKNKQRWTMVSTIRLSSQLIHCKHTCRKKNWYAGKFSTYKIVTGYVKFTFPSPITLSPFHFKHYLLRALCFFQDCCFNLHKVSSMEENVRATVTRLGEKSHLLASQLDKY